MMFILDWIFTGLVGNDWLEIIKIVKRGPLKVVANKEAVVCFSKLVILTWKLPNPIQISP